LRSAISPYTTLFRSNIKETTHKATPIFFSGAISNRTTQLGPFFSGLGMTKRLGLPLIAIADPALDADRDLKLAWYLGDATDNFRSEEHTSELQSREN